MQKKLMPVFLLLLFTAMITLRCSPGQSGEETEQAASADSLKNTEEAVAENEENNENLIPVEVTTVSLGDISDFILLSSNLETEVMADVYAQVQGIVEKIHKEEGQYVNKGDTLLSLKAEEYELAEKRTRVEYERQISNYNRQKEMHSKQLLSDDEFEQAKFALETARIIWEEAKLNLDFMQIQSPISGWVGERLTKVGARIQQSDKLFTVVNQSQVIAVVWVPEKSINEISIGQEALLTSDHIEDVQFEGWVKRISPMVDPASGTCKVTVGVRNVGRVLRPGMFVNVHIIVDTHEDVVLVPKTAVVYEKEYMNVFVVRDSVAHKVRLKPGFEDHEKIESTAGVEPGDKIIVVGQAGMKDKTRVRIVSERENMLGNREDVESPGV